MTMRSKRPTKKTAAKKGGSRLFHRGDEGRNRVDTEIERQKAARASNNQPFRFYVPVGETRTMIIVDEKPDVFMYEHNTKNPRTGKWNLFTPCIKEWDNCPVCEEHGDSYYAMFLTCIDLTEFETSSGQVVKFSRKLLCVKPSQQKKFIRRAEKVGSLRGSMFECTRDKQMESAIGGDIEFMEVIPEARLRKYVRSWKGNDGTKHTETCHEVFDYESLFEEPTRESLMALVGGTPTPGSAAQTAKDLEEEEEPDDEWEDEEDEEEEEVWEDEEDAEEDGDEEEEVDEEDEEELDEEEEEPEPAPRRRRRPRK